MGVVYLWSLLVHTYYWFAMAFFSSCAKVRCDSSYCNPKVLSLFLLTQGGMLIFAFAATENAA